MEINDLMSATPEASLSNEASLTDELRAVRAVLLELMEILSDYRDNIVVTGGVIPHLLLPPDESGIYRSTNDVDLVLDLSELQDLEEDTQDTIHEILMEHLYQQDTKKPYRWHRGVWTGNRSITIAVDLLAGERYGKEDRGIHTRVRRTHDIYASPLSGVDIALLNPIIYHLSGTLPDGTHRKEVPVRVVDLALYIPIKAIALADRLHAHQRDPEGNHQDEAAKHAFDIHECLARFPGGIDAIVDRLLPYQTNLLVKDALGKLEDAFRTVSSPGPQLLVREEKYAFEPEEVRAIEQQGSVQRVALLLTLLATRRSNA